MGKRDFACARLTAVGACAESIFIGQRAGGQQRDEQCLHIGVGQRDVFEHHQCIGVFLYERGQAPRSGRVITGPQTDQPEALVVRAHARQIDADVLTASQHPLCSQGLGKGRLAGGRRAGEQEGFGPPLPVGHPGTH